ncbi:MAG: protein sanA-like protein [Methylophaga sp.]|nr:MAG: protein sanA-like protein [Methylophaga sp.]
MIRRIRKSLLWFFLIVCAWLVFIAASIWIYGGQDHAIKSDYAIVLGAAAYHKNPSPVFKERIDHAVSLYHQGLVAKIIFTGGYGSGAPYAESEVAKRYALRKGVENADILIETRSRSTVNNLIEAKALMDSGGFGTAIIVSDPLHLKRASIIAKNLNITAVTSPTPTSRYRSFKVKFKFLVREVYFYHYYLFTRK